MKSFKLLAILTAALAMSAWAAKQEGSRIFGFTDTSLVVNSAVKITVKCPALMTTATEQDIEYAISKTATLPTAATAWETCTSGSDVEIDKLTENTMYYIFVRSQANEGYKTGTFESKSKSTLPKTDGATLNAFTTANLDSTTISISIKTAPITIPSGLTVEYAISADNTAPTAAAAWKNASDLASTVLPENTRFYVFARAQASDTHRAGAVLSVSTKTKAKTAGATLNAFTKANLDSTTTSISIKTAPTTAPAGSTVEYAISKTNTLPSADLWTTAPAGTGSPLLGLDDNTTYYVFARAKATTDNLRRAGDAISVETKTKARAEGAAITPASFAITNKLDSTTTSVTLRTGATTTPAGQTIEYAISASSTPPTEKDAWVSGISFPYEFKKIGTGDKAPALSAGTKYWVFARAKETTTNKAGTALSIEGRTVAWKDAPAVTGFIDTKITPDIIKITVTTTGVTLATPNPGTQVVEFAISATNTLPTDGWETHASFIEFTKIGTKNLTADTKYYVFARAKEKGNYKAGAAVSLETATKPKEDGDAIDVSTLNKDNFTLTTSSITVDDDVALDGTSGQEIEYAISTSINAEPAATAWKTFKTGDPKTFPNLAKDVDYYIHARAKESPEYKAGTKSVSDAVQVTGINGDAINVSTLNKNNFTLTTSSITVDDDVALDGTNGQEIEYAISETEPEPETGWTLDKAFTGLTEGRQYYIFARAQQTDDYFTGEASHVGSITPGRAEGLDVDKNTFDESVVDLITTTTITVDKASDVKLEENDGDIQVVEFGISKTDDAATAGDWNTAGEFKNLEDDTQYYVFARSKETPTHTAGTAIPVGAKTEAKGDGRAIADNTFTGSKLTSNTVSITVASGVTLGGTPSSQTTIEYGASETNDAESVTNWYAGKTDGSAVITGLLDDTEYYVFARAKENDDFKAGEPTSSLTKKTVKKNASSATIDPTTFGNAKLSATTTTITVASGVALANGVTTQAIEYAASTSNTLPTTGWTTSKTLTVSKGTQYYVFARAQENDTYKAGEALSAAIKTPADNGGCTGSCSGYPGTTPVLSQIETGNRTAHIANGLSLSVSSGATVSIYSLKGNLVQSLSYASGEHTMSLNSLPKGMYVAKVSFRSKENTLSHSETIKITVK